MSSSPPEPEPPGEDVVNPSEYTAEFDVFGQSLVLPNLPKIMLALLSAFILLFFEIPITFIETVFEAVAAASTHPLDQFADTLALFWNEPTAAMDAAFQSATDAIASPDSLFSWIFAVVVVAAFFITVSWMIDIAFGGDD